MTVSVDDPSETPHAVPEPELDAPAAPAGASEYSGPTVDEICPYLAAADGAWRSASPHREHRCRAVDPPAALSNDKQKRICLSAGHAGCATFRAARASRAAMLAPGVDPAAVAAADAARRPVARSSALILEHPRLSAPTARWPVSRAIPQAALVGLMIVAVLALAIARLSGPEVAAVAAPSPSASPTSVPSVQPTPRRTPSPAPSASPSVSASPITSPSPSGSVSGVTATPKPTATAKPTASPSVMTTYVVKKGDTLYAIASQFGTTVAEIKRVNGLTSNNLKIGQKLKIP